MIKLDRLLALRNEILFAEFRRIRNMNVNLTELKREYQSIYDELKKAEEWYNKKHRFYEIKDKLQHIISKRNLEIYHLKKKLKTPEDIEKINKWDTLISLLLLNQSMRDLDIKYNHIAEHAIHYNYDALENENKKIKEELAVVYSNMAKIIEEKNIMINEIKNTINKIKSILHSKDLSSYGVEMAIKELFKDIK